MHVGFLKRLNLPSRKGNNTALGIVIVTYLVLGGIFFSFIVRNGANILFWDQWDIFYETVQEQNLTSIFLHQHGDHRIGAGLIVIKTLAILTGWDSRVEMLLVGIIITASSLLLLSLKKKLFHKITTTDVIIPIVFFTLHQWENITWGFQIAFTLPLFFLFLALYLMGTKKPSVIRDVSLLLIFILSSFSSLHGSIVGITIAGFFFLQMIIQKRNYIWYSITTIFTFLIIALNFVFKPATEVLFYSFHFMSLLQYIFFQINSFFGYRSYDLFFWIVPLLSIFAFLVLVWKILIREDIVKNYIIFSLFSFYFIFAFLTGLGRVESGILQGQASRYVTFSIPLYVGLYLFSISILKGNIKKIVVIALFLITSVISLHYLSPIYSYAVNHNMSKQVWKECYKKNNSITFCDDKTGFKIYPNAEATHLKRKLDYLKEHNLNLFKDEK